METWIDFMSDLVLVELQYTWGFKQLFSMLILCNLGKFLEIAWLGHRVDVFSDF